MTIPSMLRRIVKPLLKCQSLSHGTVKVSLGCLGFIGATGSALSAELPEIRQITAQGYLRVQALDDHLLQFELDQGAPPESGSVIPTSPWIVQSNFPGPDAITTERRVLETSELRVEIQSGNLCVKVFEVATEKKLHTLCPESLRGNNRRLLIDSPNTRNAYGLGQYFTEPGEMNGDWIGRKWEVGSPFGNVMSGFNGGATGYTMFPILYALGQGFDQSYAIFLDHTYKQTWSFQDEPWNVQVGSGPIRWLVFVGDSLKDLRRTYMNLVGKPTMPPKTVFGLWVSEFGYDDWAEVDDTHAALKAAEFPVDGYVLDLQWFGAFPFSGNEDRSPSKFGTLRFDLESFPEPEKKIKQLKERDGLGLILIEESYVSKFLPEHDDLANRRFLAWDCGTGEATFLDSNPWWGVGGMIDWTHPAARAYWHQTKRQPLIDMGIIGHWTDLGEPEMYSSASCYHGIVPGLIRHGDVHNLLNFAWLQGIDEGYKRNEVRQRPFMMSRSGGPGIQRFGASMWSADIAANMGSLRAHQNAQLHMSLSGMDFYGSDIGGFHRNGARQEDGLNELYTQWYAISSLFDVPVRPHTWNTENTNETSPALIGLQESNRYNTRQRYELTPYYYSLAYEAYLNGHAVIPPMVYAFQDDMRVRELADQKMIGPYLMAAIVAEVGQNRRDVYLPAGRWINVHSREEVRSKGELLRDVPAHEGYAFRLPLFARSGAIIPKMYVDRFTGNVSGFRRDGSTARFERLTVYPDKKASSFTLYDDDGKTVDYLEGQFSKKTFTQKLQGQTARLTMAATKGGFAGQKPVESYRVEFVVPDQQIVGARLNGQVIELCSQLPAATTGGRDDRGQLQDRELPGASEAIQPCFAQADRNLAYVYTGEVASEAELLVEADLSPVAPTTSAYFVCDQGYTTPGTSLYVLGNIEKLGSGDVAKAVKLDPVDYPTWTGRIDGLPVGVEIEWTCIKRLETSSKVVERSQFNRTFRTSEAGYSGVQQLNFF